MSSAILCLDECRMKAYHSSTLIPDLIMPIHKECRLTVDYVSAERSERIIIMSRPILEGLIKDYI